MTDQTIQQKVQDATHRAQGTVDGMAQEAKGVAQDMVGKVKQGSDNLGTKIGGTMDRVKGAVNQQVGQMKQDAHKA